MFHATAFDSTARQYWAHLMQNLAPVGSPTAAVGQAMPIDQYGVANDPAQANLLDLVMGSMLFSPTLDQDLLALILQYFESRQSELARSRDLGNAPSRSWQNPPRRTSWSPSSSGAPTSGRPPMQPGTPSTADTSAPANIDQLPQGDRTVGTFLRAALAQNGDEYEWAAGRNLNDADPDEFDCSGLVYWSLHQAGIDPNTVGGYSGAQSEGTRTISVDEALRTPGALLFYDGHVAISLGDGRTIEAMGERWGVTIDEDATDRRWTHGGLIPGMDYGGSIGVVA
jgi:cell wall-associated NlpC family hydrolase